MTGTAAEPEVAIGEMDGPFGALGLSWYVAGRFLRFGLDAIFLKASSTAVAKRDYFLTLGSDVEYKGRAYRHMKVSEGQSFSTEVFGTMFEMDLAFVPFGLSLGESVVVNPTLGMGLVLFGGRYEIDAGPPTGVVQYQNPPEDFVVGGNASGFLGMGAPQVGPGIELRFGRPDGVNLDLRAQYMFFEYKGSTTFFSTADHRDKDLKFSHTNVRLGAQLEIPMRRVALTLGVKAQFMDSEGSIKSSSTDPEVILARRERFDKDFTFRLQSLFGTVGLAF